MTKPKGNPYLHPEPLNGCDHVGTKRAVTMLLFTESKRTNGFYEECTKCRSRLRKLRDDEVEYAR